MTGTKCKKRHHVASTIKSLVIILIKVEAARTFGSLRTKTSELVELKKGRSENHKTNLGWHGVAWHGGRDSTYTWQRGRQSQWGPKMQVPKIKVLDGDMDNQVAELD